MQVRNYYHFSLYQRTPLHMAAEGGHKNVVDYLVDKGADVSLKDNAGVSISEYTSVNGFV